MTDMFGTYEETAVVDLGGMFDGDWEQAPSSGGGILEPGKYQMRLDKFEEKNNLETGACGFFFFFQPYATEDGELVPSNASSLNIRQYFYVGKRVNGKMIANSYTTKFNNFLQSLGVNKENYKQKFTVEGLQGSLVKGTLVLGEKKLSTKEHPITGLIPTEIDENDRYTYTQYLQFADNSLIIGIKDNNGNVRKVF